MEKLKMQWTYLHRYVYNFQEAHQHKQKETQNISINGERQVGEQITSETRKDRLFSPYLLNTVLEVLANKR